MTWFLAGFATATYLGLRETEVCPDEAEQIESAPEEAGLSTPRPRSGIHHARLESADDDTHDVVNVTGQDDSLDSEAGGWQLGHEGVADRANSEVVDERQDENQGTRCPTN